MYGLEKQVNILKDSENLKPEKTTGTIQEVLPCINPSLLSKASIVRLWNTLKSYSMMRKATKTNNKIFNIL